MGRVRRSPTTPLAWSVLIAVFGLTPFAPSAALSQDTTAVPDSVRSGVTLIGEVRDASTEEPIGNAAVKILELERVEWTDSNGFFRFEDVPAGTWTFETTALAYETNSEASTIAARNILVVRLDPAPVELEGLYVEVRNLLKERRMRTPTRVIAWDRPELETMVSPDVAQMLKRRGVAYFVQCGGEFSDMDLPNCIMSGGARVRLRIYVDDVPVMPAEGSGRLWAYDPRDLWSVEFIRGCATVRIYTRVYMEWIEEGRVRPAHTLC